MRRLVKSVASVSLSLTRGIEHAHVQQHPRGPVAAKDLVDGGPRRLRHHQHLAAASRATAAAWGAHSQLRGLQRVRDTQRADDRMLMERGAHLSTGMAV